MNRKDCWINSARCNYAGAGHGEGKKLEQVWASEAVSIMEERWGSISEFLRRGKGR